MVVQPRVNLRPPDLPPLLPPPRPGLATSPTLNVTPTPVKFIDKPSNTTPIHDVLQCVWQTRRNGRFWGRSRLRKLRVVQRPSAAIRGPSAIFFFTLYIADSPASSTPLLPRPYPIKTRRIPPSRASSKRIRCVNLPCRPRLTCCSGATNNTDRCVLSDMPLTTVLILFSFCLAGCACVVRRVQRDDR